MRLLAVDPGKHAVGLSVWDDTVLLHVEFLEFATLKELAKDLIEWEPDVVVCEVPQIYPGFRSEDPNDLIDVAVVAGVCLSCAAEKAIPVRPHAWKGGVPKSIHNKRVLAALTDRGRELVEAVKPAAKRHNAIDGVGIGQWYLAKETVR